MKFYFLAASILLIATAAVADGTPSPNEKFNDVVQRIKSIQSKIESNRSAARKVHDTILPLPSSKLTNRSISIE